MYRRLYARHPPTLRESPFLMPITKRAAGGVEDDGLAFKTPDRWAGCPGARKGYRGPAFDRG